MSERAIQEMRVYLVARGLVRDPDSPGTLPPLWLSPPEGLVAPDEGPVSKRASLVVGASPAPGIPPNLREGFIVNDAVDFTIRAKRVPPILDFGLALRRELIDLTDVQMGALRVSQVQMTVPIQPLFEDEQGFSYRCQYVLTWQDFALAAARGWGA